MNVDDENRPFNPSNSRRSFLKTSISFLLAPLVRTPQEYKIDAGWPQFRGNPELSEYPVALLMALKLLDHEAGEAIESSASILNGTVYVGTQASELLALDLRNGAVRWKYKTDQNWRIVTLCFGWNCLRGRFVGRSTPFERLTGRRCGSSRPVRDQVFPVVRGKRIYRS